MIPWLAPSHSLRTTSVPWYSTHAVDPVNGCNRRRWCVFQVPMSQSKSWLPSCAVTESPARVYTSTAFVCHVLPESAEKACSVRNDVGVMSE